MIILYEDNHCLAVMKQHGVLAQGDVTGEPSLFEEVKAFIKKRDKKPGNVFLGLVHRLDRPVGGVMLFAKTSKGAARLSEAFRAHQVEKIYWAVVEGAPKKSEGTVEQWLLKNKEKNVVAAVAESMPGAQFASLDYRILKRMGPRSLVEIQPKTGRPHQIRVAMKTLGCPIIGDTKYGTKAGLGGNIALFARSLTFPQPVTKKPVTVKADTELEVFK